ncbi:MULTISPECIES: hypothetical protein [Gammaproteobacteria]|jgi:hypothetical protein|nr:hypothetical protein [Methylophaga aminisulfidivorans]
MVFFGAGWFTRQQCPDAILWQGLTPEQKIVSVVNSQDKQCGRTGMKQ